GVARLVDRLGNRLGRERVVRLVPRASHVPERACREVSALAPPVPAASADAGSAGPTPRPLHLLPWPEPIEVMAPVPDHPPVMFRWRRRRHRVACADGPERIGPEWWLEEPADAFSPHHRIRDYYRVEDTEGRRFWLYREGLYRPAVEPAWYLHGFFA
ncbi:MAG: DNA polymerase Y family protein, partial [Alphaproteobacteria bacterium]